MGIHSFISLCVISVFANRVHGTEAAEEEMSWKRQEAQSALKKNLAGEQTNDDSSCKYFLRNGKVMLSRCTYLQS